MIGVISYNVDYTVKQAVKTFMEKRGSKGLDATLKQQEHGWYGEAIAHQYIFDNPLNFDNKTSGFDGGYDFVCAGRLVDVKTMTRSTNVDLSYVHNFHVDQLHLPATTIVFCSYNTNTDKMEICGVISKNEMVEKGTYFPPNSWVPRGGGSFLFKKAHIQIGQQYLYPIHLLKESILNRQP